jgi:uncharacterized protein with HEPN domain
MDAETRTRLQTTLEAARTIQDWAVTNPYGQAANDPMLGSAYLWQLERIGGTLRLVRDVNPEIGQFIRDTENWIALGDHVLHDYRDLQEVRIQAAINDGIPLLISDLQTIFHK